MKGIAAILLTVIVLSSHSVSAKLRYSSKRGEKQPENFGNDPALGDFPHEDRDLEWTKAKPNYHYSGSCGCAGDAVKAVQAAYESKRNCLLPLQLSSHSNKATYKISLFFGKFMWLLTKYAIYLLSDVDCGDCDGYPKGYCGAPTVNYDMDPSTQMNGDISYGWPLTYDCCCDAYKIRDLVINSLTQIAEHVIERDPLDGTLILFGEEHGEMGEKKNYFYLLTAFEFFLCGGQALYQVSRTFCKCDEADKIVNFENPEQLVEMPTADAF